MELSNCFKLFLGQIASFEPLFVATLLAQESVVKVAAHAFDEGIVWIPLVWVEPTAGLRFPISEGLDRAEPKEAPIATLLLFRRDRVRHLMRRLDGGDPASLKLLVDRRHQPVEPGLVLGLGAGDQHVLRVGGAE